MLIRLFGKNFRSFKREFELSMVAADLTRKEDKGRGVIELPLTGSDEPLRLLRCVAIYGPNASGKSTALDAVNALRWLATESSPRTRPNAPIGPYEPFVLDEESKTNPIELGCDIYFHGAILRYHIQFKQKEILSEQLIHFEGDKKVAIIDLQPTGEVRGSLIENSAVNKLYVKDMQPNVSVLSKLAQHGPHKGVESAQPYYTAIRNVTHYADYSFAAVERLGANNEKFAEDAEYRTWIMKHLIQAADVGICDVNTKKDKFEFPEPLRDGFSKLVGEFKVPDHTIVVSFIHEGKMKTAIDYSNESAGTKKLFNISADWWKLAKSQVTLFVDELSASLHPRLLDRLVRAVNDNHPDRRSQFVFATHDAGLLEAMDDFAPALRRDQVYFTEKDANGESSLYSLMEFKDSARPVHNLRRRYLLGLYGGVPVMEKLSL